MPSSVQRPKSLTARATEAIREGIVTGRYPLGAPLFEKALAEEYAVSKTPVREALVQLQKEGLVRVVPHSGTFVFRPTAAEIAEICELRMVLEESGLLFSARRDGPGLAAALRRLVGTMRAALDAGDGPRYRAADAAFHRALLAHAGNGYLLAAYATIEAMVGALRVHIVRPNPREAEASFEDHLRILVALEAQHEPEAASVLRQHIGRSRDLFVRADTLVAAAT
jgi:DNA-binding GntR family transcriptional regulator